MLPFNNAGGGAAVLLAVAVRPAAADGVGVDEAACSSDKGARRKEVTLSTFASRECLAASEFGKAPAQEVALQLSLATTSRTHQSRAEICPEVLRCSSVLCSASQPLPDANAIEIHSAQVAAPGRPSFFSSSLNLSSAVLYRSR